MNAIERPIYDLLQKEPFYANFMLGAKIILNDPKVPTAAACVRKGQIEFSFDTNYLASLTREGQAQCLKHEILHVLLDHCGTRGSAYDGGLNPEAKNLAMDCAINQFIPGHPKEWISKETIEHITKRQLRPLECWEYYYEAIKDQAKKDGKAKPAPGGQGVHGEHKFMEGEGDGSELSESEKAINKAAVQDATSKAISASAGKIPDGLASILASLARGAAQLPWKQILRNFVANARSVENRPTRQRPNRRFDLDQPGRKKIRKLVLGVCTDSSGSVSGESYAAFMREIHTVAKSTTITFLVHADCVVQKVDIIKGGKPKGDVLKARHGAGGTAYQPAIDECMKRQCDAIIYFGDFDCADKPTNPGVPFLWVGVGNQEAPAAFGRVLRLV